MRSRPRDRGQGHLVPAPRSSRQRLNRPSWVASVSSSDLAPASRKASAALASAATSGAIASGWPFADASASFATGVAHRRRDRDRAEPSLGGDAPRGARLVVERERRVAAVVDEPRRHEAGECDFARAADGRASGERGQVPEAEHRRGERVGRKRDWARDESAGRGTSRLGEETVGGGEWGVRSDGVPSCVRSHLALSTPHSQPCLALLAISCTATFDPCRTRPRPSSGSTTRRSCSSRTASSCATRASRSRPRRTPTTPPRCCGAVRSTSCCSTSRCPASAASRRYRELREIAPNLPVVMVTKSEEDATLTRGPRRRHRATTS